MGRGVIQHPDTKKYAIWSSIVDDFITDWLSEEELKQWQIDDYATQIEEQPIKVSHFLAFDECLHTIETCYGKDRVNEVKDGISLKPCFCGGKIDNSDIISKICSDKSIYSKKNSPIFKEIKLKPCPFCGKKVNLRYIDQIDQYASDGYKICCSDCDITFFESCRRWFMFLSQEEREEGMRNIIERWNRRKSDEKHNI